MLTFVSIKFFNMALNGARGILLALLLGPHSYGVLGTLIVVQQYLSYLALGMREGVAIKLAQSGGTAEEVRRIYSSSLFWGLCVGLASLAALGGLHLAGVLSHHFIWVGVVSLLSIINEILINISRNEKRLLKVARTEFLYFGSALLLVLVLSRMLTIDLALQIQALGLLLSLSGFLTTMRATHWRAVSWQTMRKLIGLGVLPAVLSAVVIVVNTFYVLAANWMGLGARTGLVVFASNLSVMILFGLNTVSWGLASGTMRRLYAPSAGAAGVRQTEVVETFFRLGVAAAALLALGTELVFSHWMTEYAGSALYTFYLCLFQAHGLLLFSESNFMSVHGRLRSAVLGYVVMLGFLGGMCLLTDISFEQLLQLGVAGYFVLSLWIAFYARRLGFTEGVFTHRIAALCFPIACAASHLAFGAVGAVAACVVFGGANLVLYRHRAAEFLVGRRPKTSP